MKQKKAKRYNKLLAVLVSITLLVGVIIGGTLAFLNDSDEEIMNTFTPSQVTTEVVEELDGGTKKNVQIQNTSDIEANIRVAIVVTWQNANGEVYGTAPVAGTDYELDLDLANGWSKKADGFYYWANPVAADDTNPETTTDMTGVLIKSCTYLGNAPEGYSLNVEIIASGIQADGITGTHPWGL